MGSSSYSVGGSIWGKVRVGVSSCRSNVRVGVSSSRGSSRELLYSSRGSGSREVIGSGSLEVAGRGSSSLEVVSRGSGDEHSSLRDSQEGREDQKLHTDAWSLLDSPC